MNMAVSREKIFRVVFIFSLLLNAILVCQNIGSFTAYDLRLFFLSDMLYLPSLYKDLFIDYFTLDGWRLNASPNIIPEWPVYFFLRWISGDFRIASFLYAIVSVLLINIFTAMLYKEVYRKMSFLFLTYLSLAYSAFLLQYYFIGEDALSSFYLFLSGFHTGAFIMALLGFWLFFRYLNRGKKNSLLFLFLVSLMATFSDRLYIIYLVFPVFVSLVFILNRGVKAKLFHSLLSISAGVILGLFSIQILKSKEILEFADVSSRMLNFDGFGASIVIFLDHMAYFFKAGGTSRLIIIISVISVLAGTWMSVEYVFFRKRKDTPIQEKIFIIVIFSFIVMVLVNPIINGSYVARSIFRYNVYSLYIAVTVLSVYMYLLSRKYKILKNVFSIVLVLILAGLIITMTSREVKSGSAAGLGKLFNYYPTEVAEVDSLVLENNLKYGVANYWYAKVITMFSHYNHRVYSVYPNMMIYQHVANIQWYYAGDKGKYNEPIFDFIVLNNFENNEEIKNFFNDDIDTLGLQHIKILKVPEFDFDRLTKKPVPKP